MRLTGVGASSAGTEVTAFTLTPPIGFNWLLFDGHFGWSAPTVPTSANCRVVFTFSDNSEYITPLNFTTYGQRINGVDVYGGGDTTVRRISSIRGKITSDGSTTATLVGNFIIMEVPEIADLPPGFGTSLVAWYKAGVGVTESGGRAVAFADSSGYGQDLDNTVFPGQEPDYDVFQLDGIPLVSNPLVNGDGRALARAVGIANRTGDHFGYGVGEHQPRTIAAVLVPKFAAAAFNITGGPLCGFGSTPKFQCLFDLEDTDHADAWYLYSENWRNIAVGQASEGPATVGGAGGIYDGTPLLAVWRSTGFDNITFSLNNSDVVLSPSVMTGPTGPTISPGFIYGQSGSGALHFMGSIADVMIWDEALDTGQMTALVGFLGRRFPSLGL